MKICILIACVFYSVSLFGQQIDFPNSYLGIWKGDLHIEPAGTNILMTLQIGPAVIKDSVYRYVITYLSPTKNDVREYELHVIDKQKGLYYVDEKNGIILDEKLLGNKLCSVFSVDGSTLQITLKLHKDEIIFEVYSWPTAGSRNSESRENDETYKVTSYLMNAYQKAVLKR